MNHGNIETTVNKNIDVCRQRNKENGRRRRRRGKRTLKDLGEIEGCVYSSTWERNETATWKFSEAITHL